MTKTLPPYANFEWLKKQAKQQKKALLLEGQSVKLADVHFQIAKDYGFSSWRAFKTMFDQRDGRAQNSVDADVGDRFLLDVGEGNTANVKAALKQDHKLANCVAHHPFWGGRPQPLHLAVEGNRADMFELLLVAGADVNGQNAEYDFWSPLMLALFNTRTTMAAELSKRGARFGLCEILLSGDDDRLDTFLKTHETQEGHFPSGSLIALARTPHAVMQLLKRGFPAQGGDRWGSDAMDALSRLGPSGKPLVETLLSQGQFVSSKIVARLGDRDTLETRANEDPSLFADDDVVLAAVDFGHVDIVSWLLESGANAGARHSIGSKGTALHSAAWNGDVPMVQCLLQHGASTSLVDEEHKTTPLAWAQTALSVTNNERCREVAKILAIHTS